MGKRASDAPQFKREGRGTASDDASKYRGGADKSMTPKQIRARRRREIAKGGKVRDLTSEEQEALYGKPVEEWDMEELARGKPRGADGKFHGSRPGFVDQQVHEEAIRRFKLATKGELRRLSTKALKVLEDLLDDKEVGDDGVPVVKAGDKIKAATFIVEHVVGKPVQEVQQDVSVRLQAILATAMVQPLEAGGTGDLGAALVASPSYQQIAASSEWTDEEGDDE